MSTMDLTPTITADMAIEVLSPSTEAVDRGIKFEDYAAHGVAEYWIVDPEHEVVEQYALQSDRYELLTKVKIGAVQSVVVPGFEISVQDIFDFPG